MATTRRQLGQAALGVAAIVGLPPSNRRPRSRANILWIMVDDMTRRTLNRMPHTQDRLVTLGTEFRRGYAAIPLCRPARVSALQGQYAHNHGEHDNSRRIGEDTVATRLNAAGYATGYFGKYLNGYQFALKEVPPGWDRWVGTAGTGRRYNVDGDVRAIGIHPDEYAVGHADRWITLRPDVPWFAVFAPTNPHAPYTPSRQHAHAFDRLPWNPPSFNEADMSDKPTRFRGWATKNRAEMQARRNGQLEESLDVDDQINRLIGALAQTGQLGHTYIFMFSDNGFMFGEHRIFTKQHAYEESAGIPFVVRGPGVRRGPSNQLVSQVDLMPTALAIARLDPDAGRVLDGRSMLTQMRSGDWSDWRKRLLVEHPAKNWAMTCEGNLRYIHHHAADEEELYDLALDVHQMDSIHAERNTTRLRARTTALRQASGRALRAIEMEP